MDNENKEVRTEEIMEQVRNRVNATSDQGSKETSENEFDEVLPYSMTRTEGGDGKESWDTLYRHADIALQGGAFHSHRPVIGRLIVGVKKFFRYWTRKYTDALFAQQTRYNFQSADMMQALKERIDLLEKRIEHLEKESGADSTGPEDNEHS